MNNCNKFINSVTAIKLLNSAQLCAVIELNHDIFTSPQFEKLLSDLQNLQSAVALQTTPAKCPENPLLIDYIKLYSHIYDENTNQVIENPDSRYKVVYSLGSYVYDYLDSFRDLAIYRKSPVLVAVVNQNRRHINIYGCTESQAKELQLNNYNCCTILTENYKKCCC